MHHIKKEQVHNGPTPYFAKSKRMNTKNNTLSVEIGRLSVRWTWRVVLKDKNVFLYKVM